MTRCNNSDVNLKSTAYNQTGQTYFQRLSAYNAMSSHLRRVLLAKSVIDSRNEQSPQYKERRCRSASCGRLQSNDLSKEVTDRLTLDTRMTLNRKFPREEGCCDKCEDRYDQQNFSHHRLRDNLTNFDRNRSIRKITNFSPPPTFVRETRSPRSPTFGKADGVKQGYRPLEERIHRCGDRGVYCTSVFQCQSNRSINSSSSLHATASRNNTAEKDDEAKYAKFVYEITQDIVENGLYSDKQLLEVFKKHIQKNKDVLNMNKMLHEIYQLKITLDVSEESEIGDEIEALVYARKFSSAYELKPPTPPKVLDENKVIEKLLSYQTSMENRQRSLSPGNKSVVLVDANPELYVTERDVLLTLMEVDIDPDQAQYICKSLFHKSRETIPNEMESRASFSERKYTPEETEIDEHREDDNSKRINWDNGKNRKDIQDIGLTTEDLVSRNDKIVQVESLKNKQNLSQDSCTDPVCIPCQTKNDATIQIDLNLCSGQIKDIKAFPAKGRTSETSQKQGTGKTGKRLSNVGKFEKPRSSQLQIATQKLSYRSQKERKEKEGTVNGSHRKVNEVKTKILAQTTKTIRSNSTTNNSSATAISSNNAHYKSASQRKQAEVAKKTPSKNTKSKEMNSEKASSISLEEPDYESDKYSSDYENVDEDTEEVVDSEIEDHSQKKESWIETRDVDTDVSETNGYEYSGPEDTILTENEPSIPDKNK